MNNRWDLDFDDNPEVAPKEVTPSNRWKVDAEGVEHFQRGKFEGEAEHSLDFNWARHNGRVVVTNPEGLTVITALLTETKSGKRFAALFLGEPGDPEEDAQLWDVFGDVDSHGILVDPRLKGGPLETLAEVIMNPQAWEVRGWRFEIELRCRLTNGVLLGARQRRDGLTTDAKHGLD